MRITLESLAESLESISEPAFAVNAGGQIIAWNSTAETILGYPQDQALGESCHQILHGKDVFGMKVCQSNCLVLQRARRREPVNRFRMHVRVSAGHHDEVECSTLQLRSTENELAVIHLLRLWPGGNHDSRSSWRRGESRPIRESIPSLTPRECEVLKLLAAGKSTQQMARILGVTPATVRTHVENILRKFDVHSRLEAVAVALREGLI